MRLLRLAGEHFRNLAPFSLGTDGHVVVFHGANAQGKTNLLEAIWVLATLRPLRGHRTRDLVAWGEKEATVAGDIDDAGLQRAYRLDLGARRRTRIDGSDVRDLAEYFRGIRAIAFTPHDGGIITEEPERRRRWLDRAAFTLQPAHLERVRAYRRCLSQKSAALRQDRPSREVLDVLDEQLAMLGARLADARARALDELRPHVAAHHAVISGGTAALELRYRTAAKGRDAAERAQTLREGLAERRQGELRRRQCLLGPQKDDVRILLDGQPARHFGSRGQVRSLVLSLKLGELVAARAQGSDPLFLLDDLSSELDHQRTGRLVRTLVELDTQVFITTTDPGPVSSALDGGLLTHRVEDGVVVADSEA